MTKSTRKRLFYGLLIAFVVLGGSMVFYAQGWRLDLTSFKIKKVGAIFVRSFPLNATIYLDNKPVENKSWFLQSGTLINNLFPKNYKLKLELNGYHSWQENVSVVPTLVTEVKYAVLVPRNPETVATATIKTFWLFGDNIILEDENNNLLLQGRKIGKGEVLGWTNDNKYILAVDQKINSYFLNDVESGHNTNLNSAFKKLAFNTKERFQIFVDSFDKRHLIVAEAAKISLLDTEKFTLTTIYQIKKGEVGEKIAASQFLLTWTKFNKEQNTSDLVIYDKFIKNIRGDTPNLKGKNLKLEWVSTNQVAVLQDDGALYLYEVAGNQLKKLADDVKSFKFTNDLTAVAAVENNALEIIPLGKGSYYKFNLPDIKTAKEAVWYFDNNHLFVGYPNEIKFLDLNDGAVQNFLTVAGSRLFEYDEKTNTLYFTANNNLYSLGFPR